MKKSVKKGLCMAMVAGSVLGGNMVCTPPTANAMVVYDPSNHAENLANKLQLIKNYEKQLQQYEAQLKQLSKLGSGNLSNSLSQIQTTINNMNKIRNDVQAIGNDFSTAASEFDNTFADFSKWNGASASDYANQAKRVNEAVEKGIKQSIMSQGLASADEMAKTADSLSLLLNASQNADGIVGVTQAASQIAGLQVKEMQRMEQIIADSSKGQNLYLQKMMQADSASQKITEEFYSGSGFENADTTATNEIARISN